MRRKLLIIALLAIGMGLGFYFGLQLGQPETNLANFGWEHPAFAATASHGNAPVLDCWDCHGSHPDKSIVPPASGMSCFDCHSVQ